MSRSRLMSGLARAGRPLAVGGILLLACALAAAHFLWIAVEPQGGAVRLTFGETPEEPTQAVPVSRLAAARVLDAAGSPIALVAGEGAFTGASSGTAVTAAESWGVVDRSGDGAGAFLLEYYAKGATTPEQAATVVALPLEILAQVQGSRVTLRVQRAGRGVARAPVHVHLPSGRTLDLVADDEGRTEFETLEAGTCGVRSRWIEERAGDLDGRAFGEVRHHATLTLPLVAPTADVPPAASAPAGAAPAAADPAAYALLEGAHDARQVLPPDYPGFRCELVYQEGDAILQGQLVYRRQGGTEIALEGLDDEAQRWVRDQVLNLAGHRRGGDFAEGDGRYPLQLGPDDGNPYGRLVIVNDDLQSSYRVRDDRVLEVTRTMDGSRFTISVIETMDADDGRYIANHFVVSYRDAATGVLRKLEAYRDGYARIDGVWLPTSRTILSVTDETSPVVRTLRFRKPERLEPEPGPAQGGGGCGSR